MAGIKKIVEYDVIVGGVHESVKKISEVEEKIKNVDKTLKSLRTNRDNASTAEEKSRLQDLIESYEETRKNLVKVRTEFKAMQGDLSGITEKLREMGDQISLPSLKNMQKNLKNQFNIAIDVNDVENMERISLLLSEVNRLVAIRDKEQRAATTSDREAAQAQETLNKVLNKEATTVSQVNAAIDHFKRQMKSVREGSQQWVYFDEVINKLGESLSVYTDEAAKAKAKTDEFNRAAIMNAAGNGMNQFTDADGRKRGYSVQELNNAIKATEKLRDTTDQSTVAYLEYKNQVEAVANQLKNAIEAERQAAEEQRKNADLQGSRNKAAATMRNLDSSTVDDIKEAIEVTKKLRDEQVINTDEWKKYRDQVELAEKKLTEYADEEREFLKALKEEETLTKARQKAGDTMSNLGGSSVENIKEAIEVMKKLRDEQEAGGRQWEIYERQIVQAQRVLDDVDKKQKAISEEQSRDAAKRTMRHIDTATTEELKKAVDVFKKMRDEQRDGGTQWEIYQKKIEEAEKQLGSYAEKQKELAIENKKVDAAITMAYLPKSSVNAIKEAIEVTRKLRDEQAVGSPEWKNYSQQIEEAEKRLNSFNEAAKHKKLGAERVEARGMDVDNTNAEELRTNIKVLEQWRDTLDKNSSKWEEFNNKVNAAKGVLSDYEEKLKNSALGYVSFTNSTDLAAQSTEHLKRYEQELSKILSSTKDETERENATKRLADVRGVLAKREKDVAEKMKETEKAAKDDAIAYKGYEKIVDELSSSSLAQLKRAQEDLRKLFETTKPDDENYKTYADSLKKVNERINELNGNLREVGLEVQKTDNWFVASAKRFAKYASTWLNFYQILDAVKRSFREVLQLSDLMSDIQKRTQLPTKDIREIGEAIDKIDTRTPQSELYNLAATAGLLGLKSKEDVIGFTDAANKMSVALVELGADGAAQLMKIATVTGDVARYGVSGALEKVGSSINALTAASAASAGPIVDFVSRVGGIAANCHVTMSEVAGLGATLDALGQPMELSATSVNRFIMALQKNHRGIAAQLGMDEENLEALMAGGKTMEAMLLVLEKMKESGNSLDGVFGEMDAEGVRMKQTMQTLMGNTEMLREQIALSNDEFRKGTSMANEYAMKNENAAALLHRAGEHMKRAFVNPEAEKFFKGVAILIERISAGIAKIIPFLPYFITFFAGVRLKIGEIAMSIGSSLVHISSWKKGWGSITNAISLATKAAGGFKKAVAGGLVGIAVFAAVEKGMKLLAGHFDKMKNKIQDAKEWIGRFVTEINSATRDADVMFNALATHIRKGSTNTKEYKDLLVQANAQYGQFINYNLTETTSLQQLAAAQKAVNAGLREQIYLESRKSRGTEIINKHADDQSTALANIRTTLRNGVAIHRINPTTLNSENIGKRSIGQGTMPSVENAIMSAASDAISQGVNTGNKNSLKRILTERFEGLKIQYSKWFVDAIFSDFVSLYKSKVSEHNELVDLDKDIAASMKFESNLAFEKAIDQLKVIRKEYDKLLKDPEKNAQRLLELQANYTAVSSAHLDKMNEGTKAFVMKQRQFMKEHEKDLRSFAGLVGTFGFENLDVSKMGGDELKKYSDALLEEWKRYNENGDFKKFGERVRGSAFSSKEDANKWVHDQKEAIKASAWAQGIQAPSGWHYDPKESSRSKKDDDMSNKALAELDRYYTRMEMVIRMNLAKRKITEAEANREIEANEAEHLERRVKLRQLFTEDIDKGEQERFKMWWEERRKEGHLELVSWTEIRKEWNKADIEARGKNQLAWEKDNLEISKIAQKQMETIHKIITQYDYTGQVREEYQKQLEEIGLFWDRISDASRKNALELADARINAFKELADLPHLASMSGKDLERTMSETGKFTDWMTGKTEEEYEALLYILQNYHDATVEAEKKHATRMKKIIDQEWDGRIKEQDRVLKIQQANEKMLSGLASDGYITDSTVMRYELEHIEQRIKYQKEYIKALEERGAATKEADATLTQLEEHEAEKRDAMMRSIQRNIKEYSAALKEMMQSIATAGAEHENLTALAEIAAKRKLSIAVDETKQEYMIYSRSGMAIRKFMSEEEKLKWDMQNDARNQQLDALTDWLKKMGEKMSEDITNAFANRIALENQRKLEQQEIGEAQTTASKKVEIEQGVTKERKSQFANQLEEYRSEQMKEVEIAEDAARRKAAANSKASEEYSSNTDKPNYDAKGFRSIERSIDSMLNEDVADTPESQSDWENRFGNLFGTWVSMLDKGLDAVSTTGVDGVIELQEAVITNIVSGNERIKNDTIKSHKQMTKSQQEMAASMISAMNMYSIAYNAAMNDNLSATQRAGIATLQAVGQVVMSLLGTVMAQLVAGTAANSALGISRAFAHMPFPAALAAIAAITTTIGVATGLGVKAITKSKQEVSSLTGAASGGKKVAAGMLTYAEGNYPVLGSDGEVYNAKREDNWKTKVYSSPHYGILGEKGPELIVDGVTTRKMMTIRPDLYQDILDLAHGNGRQMVRAKAYADGNYPAMPAANTTGTAADDTQAMLVAAISQLNAQLANGITIDALGERGAVKQMQRAENWMRKHGMY